MSKSNCGKNPDCKFCNKQGVKVLLLRTSAVWADAPETLDLVPAMPAHVGQLTRKTSLTRSKFTVRQLREGYLYQFEKRAGVVGVKAYYITPRGFLYQIQHDMPPLAKPEFSCEISGVGAVNASVVSIETVESVERVWFAFTPDPLQPGMVMAYKAAPDHFEKEKRLQGFDAKAWAKTQKQQPHVLQPEVMFAHVAEARAGLQGGLFGAQPALAKLLGQQLFDPQPHLAWSSEGFAQRWHSLQKTLTDEQGAMFVLDDAIGVAQELNDGRNAQIMPMKTWLDTTDAKRVSNEWKLQIAQAVTDAHTHINKAITAKELAKIDDWEARYLPLTAPAAHGERDPKKREQIQRERDAKLKAAAQRRRQEILSKANTRFDKYTARLDMKSVKAVLDQHATTAQAASERAAAYAPDHVNFMKSEAVKVAFDHYTPGSEASGMAFGIQVGLMVIGMGGTPTGEAQLLAWLKDIQIGDGNWLLKGFTFNHAQLRAATSTLLSQYQAVPEAAGGPDWGALEQVAQSAKAVPDLMDKMLDAIEESANHGTTSWFNRSHMGQALAAYVPLMQGALRFAKPLSPERKLAQAYMGFMASSMGRLGREMRTFELMQFGPTRENHASRISGQIRRTANRHFEVALHQSGSDYYKLRMVSLIAGFEIIGGVMKLQKGSATEADARFYAETFAASLGALAAMMELLNEGVEMVGGSTSGQTARAAGVISGGLKLWAAGLAGVAGGVGAFYDFEDAGNQFKRNNYALAVAYLTKSAGGAASTLLGIGVAFTYSGPYLARMATLMGNPATRQLFERASQLAELWANRTLAQASLFSRVGLMTWLARVAWWTFAIHILVWCIADDDLEEWCETSIFRLTPSSPGYKDSAKEYHDLQAAINAVT